MISLDVQSVDLSNLQSATERVLINSSNISCAESNKKEKNIMCPICKESCRIDIKDYKISLFDCENKDHFKNNIFIDEFSETQKERKNELCHKCKKNKISYKCINCNLILCKKCVENHSIRHNTIEFEKEHLNNSCPQHNKEYNFYCEECNNNYCELCQPFHNNHKIILFKNMNKNINTKELKEKIDSFREKINNKIDQ